MSFLLSPMRRSAASLPTAAAKRTFTTTKPAQLARMTLVGRLGTDPEMSSTSNGGTVVRYAVASNHGTKDKPQTSWFKVAAFPPEGSGLKDYLMGLGKGTLVYLEGDATMRSYEDADGKKQTALNIVQTKIDVMKRATPMDADSAEAQAMGN